MANVNYLRSNHSVWEWGSTWGGICFMLLLFHITPVWGLSCEQKMSGYITQINSPSSFKLMHGKWKVEINVKTPLYEGDKITVTDNAKNTNTQIWLKMGDDKPLSLDYNIIREKPYIVPAAKQTSNWQWLLKNACEFVKDEVLGISSRYEISAVGKEWQNFMMPLLTEAVLSKLEAGKEVLYLTWIGGKAPYSVELLQFDSVSNTTGEILVKKGDKDYSKVTVVHLAQKFLTNFEIKPNVSYKVNVTDAKNEKVELEDGLSHHVFIPKEVEEDKCHLALAGGKAPYIIRIQGDGSSWKQEVCTDKGKILCGNLVQFALRKKLLQERNFELTPPHTYWIIVTDMNGKGKKGGKFNVIPKKTSSNTLKSVMELTKHKESRFEAYQRVMEMINNGDNTELAKHLKRHLEYGRGF